MTASMVTWHGRVRGWAALLAHVLVGLAKFAAWGPLTAAWILLFDLPAGRWERAYQDIRECFQHCWPALFDPEE